MSPFSLFSAYTERRSQFKISHSSIKHNLTSKLGLLNFELLSQCQAVAISKSQCKPISLRASYWDAPSLRDRHGNLMYGNWCLKLKDMVCIFRWHATVCWTINIHIHSAISQSLGIWTAYCSACGYIATNGWNENIDSQLVLVDVDIYRNPDGKNSEPQHFLRTFCLALQAYFQNLNFCQRKESPQRLSTPNLDSLSLACWNPQC